MMPIINSFDNHDTINNFINNQTDRLQNDYKYIMKELSQGVKFISTAAMQSAHHVLHLILINVAG